MLAESGWQVAGPARHERAAPHANPPSDREELQNPKAWAESADSKRWVECVVRFLLNGWCTFVSPGLGVEDTEGIEKGGFDLCSSMCLDQRSNPSSFLPLFVSNLLFVFLPLVHVSRVSSVLF